MKKSISNFKPYLSSRQNLIKSGLLLFFTISTFTLSGQMKLNISPMLLGKMNFSRLAPEDNFSTEKSMFEKQQVYMPYSLNYSSRIVTRPTVNFGIAVDLTSENDLNKFQLSWNTDKVSYEVESSFRHHYSEVHDGFYGMLRRQYDRITLSYARKITKSPSFIVTRLTAGLGMSINFNSYDHIDVRTPLMTHVDQNTILKETYVQPFAERKFNGCLLLGLESDLYFFKKYFFSVHLLFNQGLKNISRVDYVQVYEKANMDDEYSVSLVSKGSGFYIGISRSFQLFPWRPNKKSR
ncbi:MAG: hypothetical protein ACQERC_01230 [Bacteroidota bacterium]